MPFEVKAVPGEPTRFCVFRIGSDGEIAQSDIGDMCFLSQVHALQVSEAMNSEMAYQLLKLEHARAEASEKTEGTMVEKSFSAILEEFKEGGMTINQARQILETKEKDD